MSNSIELTRRIEFIAARIDNGDTSTEIMHEWSQKWEVSERTIGRYIYFAMDLLDGQIKRRDAVIEAARAEAIAEATDRLYSNLELEAKMCEIVDGAITSEREVVTKDGVKNLKSKFSRDRIMAINSLWKRRARYDKQPEKDKKWGSRTGAPVIVVGSQAEKDLIDRV